MHEQNDFSKKPMQSWLVRTLLRVYVFFEETPASRFAIAMVACYLIAYLVPALVKLSAVGFFAFVGLLIKLSMNAKRK